MIIGNGLLANAFKQRSINELGATIFASGVSNSQETDISAFTRERELLFKELRKAPDGPFVYFSTCSITDPHRAGTPYTTHKRAMEALVTTHPGHIILRLPQVVGFTSNPYTLTNFLADRINRGLPLDVWRNATRCLIDIDSVAALTTLLIRNRKCGLLSDLAPPEVVTMPELVHMMEKALRKRAQCTFINQGGGGVTNPALAISLAAQANEDFGPGYTLRTILKYYGKH